MNYIFKTTATMKEYNNKKWWIDTTALKKDAPEIAAKYTRTTESRRFTFA